MLQRIQTVFLSLVVVIGLIAYFLPILGFSAFDSFYLMNFYKTVSVDDASTVIAKNMGVGVLQGVVQVLSLIIIFLYKNRQLQMKLAKFNILLIALQIAAIVVYIDVIKSAIGVKADDILISFKFGAAIPLLSLILTYLAIHFIKKDEKLVRSADRLR